MANWVSLPSPSFFLLPARRPMRQRTAGALPSYRSRLRRCAPLSHLTLNDLLSLGQHRVWKRMAVSWSGAKVGDVALDLCCGSGDLAFLLSEKVDRGGKVIGLDFSKEQLSFGSSRQYLKSKSCHNNIEFVKGDDLDLPFPDFSDSWVKGDALHLPFPDCYFDAITMGYGMRNVIDKTKAMTEMFKIVKPGFRVSILDFNKSTQPFVTSFQEWMIYNVVVPVASSYGLAKEYEYLKSSINGFLTGSELEDLALESGFSKAKFYEISGGLMGNLVTTQ